MKQLVYYCCVFVSILALAGASSTGPSALAEPGRYAVLVAGSKEYMNYRHSADVCHAYHVLRDHGVPETNIIVMMYDDIAYSEYNPYPGKLFNHVTQNGTAGRDVYAGCLKNYTRDNVTADHFLAVLTGNSSAVPTGLPVLETTLNDDIFVYFSDHGGSQVSCFPDGDLLHAADLVLALGWMHDQKRYRKMAIYWESCESGSMFQSLPANWSIYVATASNAYESSWGTFCPPDDLVDGVEIGSCLGDEFSVNWMQDSDLPNSMRESLEKQFTTVRLETAKSHVTQWADTRWSFLPISLFQSNSTMMTSTMMRPANPRKEPQHVSWNARDMDVKFWEWRVRRSKTAAEKKLAKQKLRQELSARQYYKQLFTAIVLKVKEAYDLGSCSTDDILYGPVRESYRCDEFCRMVFATVEQQCFYQGKWSTAALPYTRTLVNLAQLVSLHLDSVSMLTAIIHSACQPE